MAVTLLHYTTQSFNIFLQQPTPPPLPAPPPIVFCSVHNKSFSQIPKCLNFTSSSAWVQTHPLSDIAQIPPLYVHVILLLRISERPADQTGMSYRVQKFVPPHPLLFLNNKGVE